MKVIVQIPCYNEEGTLEGVIADELWPLPKYFEMFNIK